MYPTQELPISSNSNGRIVERPRIVLTIAGHDPTGGAGITSDIKTFQYFGVYGLSVVTAVTVQNTSGVFSTNPVEAFTIAEQLQVLRRDIPMDAVKIGMLSMDAVDVVARFAKETAVPIILDPIIASSNGIPFLEGEAIEKLKTKLLPHCTIVTPNLGEASLLTGISLNSEENIIAAAKALYDCGVKNILIKGGHASGEYSDDLFYDGSEVVWFSSPRRAKSVHGTGCLLSASIASLLAKGYSLREAIHLSKEFISSMIDAAVAVGSGRAIFQHPQLELSHEQL